MQIKLKLYINLCKESQYLHLSHLTLEATVFAYCQFSSHSFIYYFQTLMWHVLWEKAWLRMSYFQVCKSSRSNKINALFDSACIHSSYGCFFFKIHRHNNSFCIQYVSIERVTKNYIYDPSQCISLNIKYINICSDEQTNSQSM